MSLMRALGYAVYGFVSWLYSRVSLVRERIRSGVTWNPQDREYQQRPTEAYEALRERDPIHFSPMTNGWVFTRTEDCDAILRDHRRFSNDMRLANAPLGFEYPDRETPSILTIDPPDHTRLRALVSRAFTPKAVEELRPRIEAVTDELLDAVDARVAAGERQVEMMSALATPLPVTVIAEMIGIPPEDLPRFKVWSDQLARTGEPTITFSELEVAGRASGELDRYFDEVIEQRRVAPRDDLVSRLIAAEEDGDQLSHEEVLSLLELLLVAGNETTTNLIGNGLLALLQQPEQLERLRREPELIESAVEELLRFDSPVQATWRVALEDLEWDGHRIKRGQVAILLMGGANHDPARYEHPERLDVGREPNRHLSFGRGIHHCLGAPLARLEGQVVFARLLERYEMLRLAEEPRFKDHIVLRGLTELRVEVAPARVAATASG